MKRILLIFIALIGVCELLQAYNTTVDSIALDPGKAGGVYYAYPITDDSQVCFTKPPKGYEPFYVSHYGRHGSRYLINDKDYKNVLDWLRIAYYSDILTDRGRLLKEQMDTIWMEARGRGGELTPLGNRQHREIAHRLILNNPQIFEGTPEITAKSTVIMRCAHSMFSFLEGLKDVNPTLEIPRESGTRAMDYLNNHTPQSNVHSGHSGAWYPKWRNFRNDKTNPERLMSTIFKDDYLDDNFAKYIVDIKEAMWDLYWIAIDLQNMETPIRLYDLFTPQELYDLWQVFNFNFYACNSSYPSALGTLTDNAQNLLKNIIDTADEYIAEGKNGATLRFGHDGNITPLTALMQLEDCWTYVCDAESLADHWADYHVSPMAANLQMIFYRSKENPEILVKLMLNEKEIAIDKDVINTDIFPFYRWSELRPALKMLAECPSWEFLPVEYIEGDGFDEWLEEEEAKFQ